MCAMLSFFQLMKEKDQRGTPCFKKKNLIVHFTSNSVIIKLVQTLYFYVLGYDMLEVCLMSFFFA